MRIAYCVDEEIQIEYLKRNQYSMSSCRFCDRIVVLDHGAIAESGTHEQLLQLKGIYAELYGVQAQYYR